MKSSIKVKKEQQTLPVMESFLTIQGEGHHSGRAAYFIRLAGCDVGCVWCDVKESWDAGVHPKLSVDEIIADALSQEAEIVVVTGGEPLMHDLTALTEGLQKVGLQTHIETSGAHPLSGNWDWLCFSPKKFMKPREEFYIVANELKVVVYNSSDFQWAEKHSAECHSNTLLYLQPEWSKREQMTPDIVEYVKKNPRWRISLQVHKYMNIP